MPPINPPHTNPGTLAEVLENARAYSIEQFKVAFAGANIQPPQPADATDTAKHREEAKAKIAEYEKAQRAMSAAIQQIASIDRQAGQAAILAQASTTAANICRRLEWLMGVDSGAAVAADAVAEIDSLTAALTALAALAPAALWKDAASGTNASGPG